MDASIDQCKTAVQIAPRIWWVGHVLPNDPFQCHVYLIENGDQSVLVDPGSVLTFRHTLAKIEQIVPFSHIRYFICSHQDPDITGCLPLIDRIVSRDDAVILSHWRAITLIRHLGLSLPFTCVEEKGWHFELDNRKLEFVFTPYLHFPGAFCTFDAATGTLFSSDLFGGFTDNCQLFAQDFDYFEAMRPFHEHYMPSRDILFHTLCKLEKYPLQLIAPQHGSIIPQPFIAGLIGRLKTIECGLYLMTHTSSDIKRLTKLNAILRTLQLSLATFRDFSEVANTCYYQIHQVLPVLCLEFLALKNESLVSLSRKKPGLSMAELPPEIAGIFLHNTSNWVYYEGARPPASEPYADYANSLIIPLVESEGERVIGCAILKFSGSFDIDEETKDILVQLAVPLSVAVERELIYQGLESERLKYYEQSIRDPLTRLYTRFYMHEAVRRLLSIHDRNPSASFGILSFDIDHFKLVNDNFGHQAGDEVLKEFAALLIQETREEDIQVRVGGEEFAVFIVNVTSEAVQEVAERIRNKFKLLQIGGSLQGRRFTVSCGAVLRKQQETIQEAMHRADMALYRAKNSGRDQVCCDFA